MKIEPQATSDLVRRGAPIAHMPVTMAGARSGRADHEILTDLSVPPSAAAAIAR